MGHGQIQCSDREVWHLMGHGPIQCCDRGVASHGSCPIPMQWQRCRRTCGSAISCSLLQYYFIVGRDGNPSQTTQYICPDKLTRDTQQPRVVHITITCMSWKKSEDWDHRRDKILINIFIIPLIFISIGASLFQPEWGIIAHATKYYRITWDLLSLMWILVVYINKKILYRYRHNGDLAVGRTLVIPLAFKIILNANGIIAAIIDFRPLQDIKVHFKAILKAISSALFTPPHLFPTNITSLYYFGLSRTW